MQTHAPKTRKTATHSLASISRAKQGKSKDSLQFADNRPESLAQRKLHEGIRKTAQTMSFDFPRQRVNRTGLPDRVKSGMEKLSGMDMSDVRVHRNSSKPAAVQAHAYTQGNQIFVASGQEKHIPHEAWHVVQQKQGRVKATTSVNGMAVNDSAALEKEADAMGSKAVLS